MSGYMIAMGACLSCRRAFSFNPLSVPSFRRTPEAELEPICPDCMARVNAMRADMGLPPHPIAADAYEPTEAC